MFITYIYEYSTIIPYVIMCVGVRVCVCVVCVSGSVWWWMKCSLWVLLLTISNLSVKFKTCVCVCACPCVSVFAWVHVYVLVCVCGCKCVSILLSIIGLKANKQKKHFNMRVKWSTVLFSHRSIMIFPILRYTSYTEFTIKKKFNF